MSHNGQEPWKVHLVYSGQKTLTGGRLNCLRNLIGKRTFMMTYGDGVSNVKIDDLLTFHQDQKAVVTQHIGLSDALRRTLVWDQRMSDLNNG